MRFYDNGSLFTVSYSAADVWSFASRWPCSGMRDWGYGWFEFDKRNGDLVGLGGSADDRDASGAAAFADDCKAYGLRKLAERERKAARKAARETHGDP